MANNKITSPTKVVIPCRISFANIWEPKSINGGEEKYSVSCIIPKSDKATLMKILKAIEAAKEAGKDKKWSGKIPPNLKLPLRDGDIDRADDDAYAESMFINASSKDAPQIVDRKVQPILDPMECGSGDFCSSTRMAIAASRRVSATSSLSDTASVLRAGRPLPPSSRKSKATRTMPLSVAKKNSRTTSSKRDSGTGPAQDLHKTRTGSTTQGQHRINNTRPEQD